MNFFNNRTLHDRRHGRLHSAVALAELAMAHLTADQVESSTGGVLVSGARNTPISGISIDSRTILPGDLFFAIRGPRTDGHMYVPSALSKGACGAIVDLRYEAREPWPGDQILVRVDDTHQALKDLAADVRSRWRGSLVAITGSVGKTTTKEFVAHVLATEYSIYRSAGNYNNLFGLPLSLTGLSPEDHIGIFEMGMSAPGEIAEMCRIARPDLGIITAVAAVHLAFFNSVEEIAHAKGELAAALEPNGTLVYNADDPLVQGIASRFTGPKISFGLSERADVRATEIEAIGLEETRFQVSHKGMTHRAVIPLVGIHCVMNTLPAITLGHHYRIPPEQVIESLRDLLHAPMRGQVLRFKPGFIVIDDSYNSNPFALRLMIQTLGTLRSYRRRILLAGEMLELGNESAALHYQCGIWAAKCGIDLVVAVQGNALELARGAVAGGIMESQVHFFADTAATQEFIDRTLRPGDVLLVKGSRAVHLERIVQALRADYAEEVT